MFSYKPLYKVEDCTKQIVSWSQCSLWAHLPSGREKTEKYVKEMAN